ERVGGPPLLFGSVLFHSPLFGFSSGVVLCCGLLGIFQVKLIRFSWQFGLGGGGLLKIYVIPLLGVRTFFWTVLTL
ncbi:hypothetical protein, partial [uncultured Megasphaera sp.]|uniref:hypothetical protein n=1 Tax=uncultured Megasphaera sp. TaxID=165188 RepID=UPI002596E15E